MSLFVASIAVPAGFVASVDRLGDHAVAKGGDLETPFLQHAHVAAPTVQPTTALGLCEMTFGRRSCDPNGDGSFSGVEIRSAQSQTVASYAPPWSTGARF